MKSYLFIIMKTGLCIVAFLIVYGWFVYSEIKTARKIRQQQRYKDSIVVARLKKKENGLWLCKFFLCGDHLGYFEKQPTSERVKAVVVAYIIQKQLYKLEEFVEE